MIYFPSSNFRVKAKFPDYVRLHRIVTGVSTKSIWNSLRNGDSFEELLASIPDELYRWVEAVRDDLLAQYAGWMKKAYEQFARVVDEFFDGDIAKARVNRKDFALAVANIKQNGLLFKILDNKLINDDIWKMLEPEFKRPNYALGDEE